MPDASAYGNYLAGHTQFHLNAMGPSNSKLALFQFPFMFRDVVFWFDDFTQNIAANLADHYTLGTDCGSTAFAKNAGSGGRIQGATQGAAGDFVAILTGADWLGDQNAGSEMRWQIDDICNNCWEFGFTDPLGDNTLGALNDIDTPSVTNCAADIAVIGLQSDATLTTAAFVTEGSTACMAPTKTNLCTYAPTAAQYQATRVQLTGNASRAYVLDNNFALQTSAQHGCAVASQLEGGTAETVRLILGVVGACAAKTVTVDYWAIWQDRR